MSKYSLPLNNVGVAAENSGVTSDITVGPSHRQIQQTADRKQYFPTRGCESVVANVNTAFWLPRLNPRMRNPRIRRAGRMM